LSGFLLNFLCYERERERERERETAAAPSCDEAKPILIVEDNADLLRMLTVYFRKVGHKVVAAKNGLEALQAFTPGQFGLLLADVNLGDGLNGIEVAQKLREKEPKLRFMSGEPANLTQAKAAGLGDCLQKPLDLALIQQLLGLKP
jgi:CheY-like chemotaxis protein